ncbi:MAG: DNA replication and repair protein RecF [Muribaculaceae bacterium]|nr:DNA replication and repair protein RecF [Muribaculaceae bacterium]
MLLQRLALANFKNIEGADLAFSPKINCFLGNNGMGKSNLLDAIYVLSYCRSFTGASDPLLLRRDSDFATLHATYRRRDVDEELTIGMRRGQRKILHRNGKAYPRLADHLGAFPAVLLSPADMDLTAGEPSARRRFIDQISSQRDARYLDTLVRYNSLLEQRNRLLRDGSTESTLYDVLDMQLEAAADYLEERRRTDIAALEALFTPYYTHIAGNAELATLRYVSADYSAEGGLAAHLAATRGRDLALKHTASGPHRADIEFCVDGLPVRRTASQGQAKTFTTALRFAQYDLLRRSIGVTPLLLLDDIFDKLDADRVDRIVDTVAHSDTFGQIFITDTNRRHLDETIATMDAAGDYRLWQVEHGAFTPIESSQP